MRKFLCAALAVMLAFSAVGICSAANERVLTASEVTDKNMQMTVTGENTVRGLERKAYFGFDNVDLTGINSVEVNAYNKISGQSNGETLAVVIDDPNSGKLIGTVTLTEVGEDITAKGSIEPTTGVHKLYFRCLYAANSWNEIQIKKITLSPKKYVNDKESKRFRIRK